jgi:cell division inhibitor SulA/protein ImuA
MAVPADLARLPGVWLGNALATVRTPSLPTGFGRLDRELPGGGWPTGTLTEILVDTQGVGEVGVLLPALAHVSRAGRWQAWIAPPHLPYAPALAQAGIDLAKLIVVAPEAPRDVLWAVEQTLRSAVCGAVLAWPQPLGAAARVAPRTDATGAASRALKYTDLRRLQIAAESSEVLAVLFRPAQAAGEASPAALRLAVAPHADGRLALHVVKRRGSAADAPVILDIARHAVDRGPSAAPRPRRVPPGELVN